MRRLVGTLAAAVAGVAAGVSFEPYHWVLLLPLAVAALTWLCVDRRPWAGFGLGVVFGTAFMLVLLPWVQVIGVFAWIPLALVEGLFYGLAGLATAAVSRLRWWPLWAAAAWVGVELLRASVPFGGFPWGRLAFAAEDTPVAPAMAYVGAAGTTFLVALVGTSLAWGLLAVRRRTPLRAAAGVAAAAALACGAAVVPPASAAPETGRDVTVAAVQGDVPGTGLEALSRRRAVLDNHVDATLELADRVRTGRAARPDLVVWPENSSDIDPYADPSARAAVGAAAEAVGAPLLMGAVVGDRPATGWFNRAIVWSAQGVPGAHYDKIHPVPFGEYVPLRGLLAPLVPLLDQMIPSDMRRGNRPGVLRVGPATVGTLMCFEVAYDGLVRDLVRGGADLLVVPTNNSTYTGTGQVEQQFAMSRLRAVETHRYVVVASTNGISGVIGPDGSVLARAPEQARAVLEQPVPLLTGLTPAVRLGAWPERGLAAIALVAAVLGLLLGYRRSARRRPRTTVPAPPPPEDTDRGRAPTYEHS